MAAFLKHCLQLTAEQTDPKALSVNKGVVAQVRPAFRACPHTMATGALPCRPARRQALKSIECTYCRQWALGAGAGDRRKGGVGAIAAPSSPRA